jgi:hypothetical protein
MAAHRLRATSDLSEEAWPILAPLLRRLARHAP